MKYVTPDDHEFDFSPEGIRCDGKPVAFPDLHEPTALALANDGTLMVADSGIGPRQQVLFYDVSDAEHPRLVRTFGEYGGIASGTPGVVTPTKFWGIRGVGMDAQGNLFVAMSEMGSCPSEIHTWRKARLGALRARIRRSDVRGSHDGRTGRLGHSGALQNGLLPTAGKGGHVVWLLA